MVFFYVGLLVSLFMILFSVMFITLLERKALSYSQTRVGPNKVSAGGIFQPLLDGVKLILKESATLAFLNKIVYGIGPFLFLMLMLIIWFCIPCFWNFSSSSFSVVFLMICVGLGVYSSLISGWSSNSKFSMVGSIRAMSQTISYEIGLAIIFFVFLNLTLSLSLLSFLKMKSFFMSMLFYPVLISLLLSLVAECNRAPFDFAEGESELVSGFNTEYFSVYFAFLFIAEYGMILFFCLLTSCFLFFTKILSGLMFTVGIFVILFIRSVYPRFRYDKLMFMVWFKILPLVIIFSLVSFTSGLLF